MMPRHELPIKRRTLALVEHVFPKQEKNQERNDRIREAYARLPKKGALVILAREFGLTKPRIHQIVFGRAGVIR